MKLCAEQWPSLDTSEEDIEPRYKRFYRCNWWCFGGKFLSLYQISTLYSIICTTIYRVCSLLQTNYDSGLILGSHEKLYFVFFFFFRYLISRAAGDVTTPISYICRCSQQLKYTFFFVFSEHLFQALLDVQETSDAASLTLLAAAAGLGLLSFTEVTNLMHFTVL